jgi:hypothetical protein
MALAVAPVKRVASKRRQHLGRDGRKPALPVHAFHQVEDDVGRAPRKQ